MYSNEELNVKIIKFSFGKYSYILIKFPSVQLKLEQINIEIKISLIYLRVYSYMYYAFIPCLYVEFNINNI